MRTIQTLFSGFSLLGAHAELNVFRYLAKWTPAAIVTNVLGTIEVPVPVAPQTSQL